MTQWNYCPVCAQQLITDQHGHPTCPSGHFTKYSTPVASTIAFVRNNDEYLIIKRARNPEKGKWSLPGGFLGYDETAYDAIVREIEEETGLTDIELVDTLGTFPSTYGDIEKVLGIAYVFETSERQVVLSDENSEYSWCRLENLPPLTFQDCRLALEELRKRML